MRNTAVFLMIGLGLFVGTAFGEKLERIKNTGGHFIVSPAALYQSDNELYFNNKLPKAEVIEGESPDGEDDYGVTWHPVGSNIYKMWISPKNNDSMSQERQTVLHESCHIKNWSDAEANGTAEEWRYKDRHGDEFQDCMLTLAKKGAFKDVW